MKTAIIVSMVLIALDLSVSNNLFPEKKRQNITCTIVYSEDENAMMYGDSLANCNVIDLRSLPPATDGNVPVKSVFIKGNYMLKSSVAITAETGYDFVLEDQLTGSSYNLKSETPYKFNVNRTIPNRFVLQVKKSPRVSKK